MGLLDGFRSPNQSQPEAPGITELLTARARAREEALDPDRATRDALRHALAALPQDAAQVARETDAMRNARAALRTAINAVPAVETTAAELTAQTQRASEMVDAARADLAKHDELDGQIKTYLSDASRTGSTAILPADLTAARRARTESKEHLELCLEGLADATRTSTLAAAEIAAARVRVSKAEAVVLRLDIITRIATLKRAESLLGRERAFIAASAMAWSLTELGTQPNPPELDVLCAERQHRELTFEHGHHATADTKRWSEYRNRLLQDPEATLEP